MNRGKEKRGKKWKVKNGRNIGRRVEKKKGKKGKYS